MTNKPLKSIMKALHKRMVNECADIMFNDDTIHQAIEKGLNDLANDTKKKPANLVFSRKGKPMVQFYIDDYETLFTRHSPSGLPSDAKIA